MKVILQLLECNPAVKMECDCKEQFWIDPCDEENLFWDGKELIAKCPKCGKLDDKFRLELRNYAL